MRVTFPHLPLARDVNLRFVGTSRDPRQSISGAETVLPSFGGRWEATCSFVLKDEGATLAWQAFLAQMEGRIGTTLVPIRSRFRTLSSKGLPVAGCMVAGFDDVQTTDHFGFEATARPSFNTNAALRATDLKISVNNASEMIRPGHMFSLGERLYRVQHHWQDDDGDHIRVQPPLREAYSGPAIANAPVCLMRFASDDEGVFEQLLDRLPTVTVTFVEAI